MRTKCQGKKTCTYSYWNKFKVELQYDVKIKSSLLRTKNNNMICKWNFCSNFVFKRNMMKTVYKIQVLNKKILQQTWIKKIFEKKTKHYDI